MPSVLVTGANRGLGLEFARQYAQDGARVFACARLPGEAKELLDLAAASKGKVTVLALDVASDESASDLAREIVAEPIDILINNAGTYGGAHQRLGDIDYDAWLRTLNVNTLGPVRVTEALRSNLTKGRDKKIVAISSNLGSTARHDGSTLVYRSSKAALNNVMRGLALALKPDGFTVAILHPGWVKTDMGGPGATLTPEVSVSAMRKIISELGPADTGVFLNQVGSEIDW